MNCGDCQHTIRHLTSKIFVLLAPPYRAKEDELSDQAWQLVKAFLAGIDKCVASKEDSNEIFPTG